MKRACCVCRRSHKNCEIVILTDEEKAVMASSGFNPVPNDLAYCPPCWKILGSTEQGAQLIRGIIEVALRRLGVADAESRAAKFHQGLLALPNSGNLVRKR